MSTQLSSGLRLLLIIWGVIFMIMGVSILIPLFVWKTIAAILLIILGVAILFAGLTES